MIIIFFLVCTLSTFLSGLLLPKLHQTAATKATGRALMLTGLSFAIWSAAVITKPAGTMLNFWISAGAFIYIGALVFFTKAAVSSLPAAQQQLSLVAAVVYAVVMWFVRLALPSNPGFSADGLFFFQPHDVVKFMYVVLMVLVILPAIHKTAEDIRVKDQFTARMFSAALTANMIGGILLLVSVMNLQDTLMYLVGWGMAIAQLLLFLASAGIFHQATLKKR